MTDNEYLKKILDSQLLSDDSDEIIELNKCEEAVRDVLTKAFGKKTEIRVGGSNAKGTRIKAAYDLDIHCYLPNECNDAGETLEDIYNNFASELEKHYVVGRKRSALRLSQKPASDKEVPLDLHIDVVPGRFTGDDEGNVYIFQNEGKKERRKTNLQTHIDHIKNSGVVDVICLMKLWRTRNKIQVRTFVLELLVVDLLEGKVSKTLAEQLSIVLTAFRDDSDDLRVEDPANPTGNDLSDLMDQSRPSLKSGASETLKQVDKNGWQEVLGALPNKDSNAINRSKLERLIAIKPTIQPVKPWSRI